MLPILFWKINTYYVLWSAALVLMCLWTRRRACRIYGVSFADSSDILWWALLGAFIGATLGGYLNHWDRYAENPAALLRFWESGASSGPGFIVGGLFGLWKIKRLGVSADRFAEASAIPCAFMLAVGRLGCFANGCCTGLPTDSPFGVRFPAYPDLAVWPSQIFESTAALLIGAVLIAIERYRLRRCPSPDRAIIFPIFLISYGAYRFVFDFLRQGGGIFGLGTGQLCGVIAVAAGIWWLSKPLFRGQAARTS